MEIWGMESGGGRKTLDGRMIDAGRGGGGASLYACLFAFGWIDPWIEDQGERKISRGVSQRRSEPRK